ncbi:MAG TPA: TIGR04348 family glycosyltransferase, partial [Blastocatellia bacterium]|nr:TIGR04348 family glycosyltransferase [Blastocatellia bacterium]
MKIGIVTPAPPGSRHGNRVTALRWARILRSLGHHVTITQNYEDESYDLLIALHALRSHKAIKRFHCERPDRPLVVALTGTDLYHDLPRSERARLSLELATRLIALQPKAFDTLPEHLHAKTRVIYQSVEPFPKLRNPRAPIRNFTVCVIGHLRKVKDPFRAAMAARLLPASSRIRIIHVGGAM